MPSSSRGCPNHQPPTPTATAQALWWAKCRTYRLRAVVQGATIQVFLDNQPTPLLDLTDEQPLISGKAELRVFNANAAFDNFRVAGVSVSGTGLATRPAAPAGAALTLAPNPATGLVTLHWQGLGATPVTLTVLNGLGQLVQQQVLPLTASYQLPSAHLANGLYVVRLQSEGGVLTSRLFISR